MKTIKLKSVKPRNPFVAAAMRRSAGRHGGTAGARRQQAQRELRQEIYPDQKSP